MRQVGNRPGCRFKRDLSAVSTPSFHLYEKSPRAPMPRLFDISAKHSPISSRNNSKYPIFKKKHRTPPCFTLAHLSSYGLTVRIARIGIVRTTEALRVRGRMVSATVKATAGSWSIVVLVNVSSDIYRCPSQASSSVIGIDLGLKMMATLSDGTHVESPRPLRHHIHCLRRPHRQMSRRKSGSKRRARASDRVAREHARVSRIRQSFLHSLTTDHVKTHDTIVIEDLHVAGMIGNHTLARSISDAGWGNFVDSQNIKVTVSNDVSLSHRDFIHRRSGVRGVVTSRMTCR